MGILIKGIKMKRKRRKKLVVAKGIVRRIRRRKIMIRIRMLVRLMSKSRSKRN